jgi:hypothetical protein
MLSSNAPTVLTVIGIVIVGMIGAAVYTFRERPRPRREEPELQPLDFSAIRASVRSTPDEQRVTYKSLSENGTCKYMMDGKQALRQ